ncbi:DUF429 domain-containing protein [Leptolyngbya sp. AN02str]|uniref:DUF429 domain-containing protein n=1 Tax=Leptolyngbya sp. AN02str TaxID=3423363 RepID=UPI003D31AB39
MHCIGIDLGWTTQPSGVCCLTLHGTELYLTALHRLSTFTEVLTWIDTQAPTHQAGIIAVDAPTLIPNATGMRLCDRLAHRHFGKYHAGCYPANQGLAFAPHTVGFGLSLEDRGFVHAPHIQPQQPGRYQIEVFPHPASIRLFQLQQILKYKKGAIAQRKEQLTLLRHYLLETLPTLEPAINWADSPMATLPPIPQRGTDLKAVEDQLDALICAYVAAHWWYWGTDRNTVLGDRTTGYIIVPDPFLVAAPH